MDLIDFLPILLAFLTGLFFLQRIYILPFLHSKTPDKSNPNHHVVCKEPPFPDNWFVGNSIFELEKRAIFSKTYLYASHTTRFRNPGDYHTLTLAGGLPIFLILGKDRTIRAFHDVCRHRAYSVTRKEVGSSMVLGCRYHGWSYDTSGRLVKAPQFEDVQGFEKSENGLWEVRTRVGGDGLVWVDLESDTGEEDEGDGELELELVLDEEVRWVGGGVVEGGFNWKMGVRSTRFLDAQLKQGIPQASGAVHFLKKKLLGKGNHSERFVFPNASFHAIEDTDWRYSLRFIPMSQDKTSIRFDLFCSRSSVDSGSRVLLEEKLRELVKNKIRKLEAEYQGYVLDPRTPTFGLVDADTQKLILDRLEAHAKLERTHGSEIHPAMRQSKASHMFLQADRICKQLECRDISDGFSKVQSKETLAW